MHQEILLHLTLISGIGASVIQKIIRHQLNDAGFSFAELYNYSHSDFMQQYGFSFTLAEKLVDGLADSSQRDRELELLARHHISLVSMLDPHYPSLLKEIHLPPALLYCSTQDAAILNSKSIAIVGSRKADRYAYQFITSVVPNLLEHGWTIVSGGALGADSMAHQEVVNQGGKTIAILGSGLLVPYPSSNKKLFAQIVETGGALISPFPLQMQPMPGNFPARNRIIAGMSKGCIVVQAQEQSGASITARFALEQGRELFALPGAIDNPLSAGCHRLIQQGAKLTQSAQDVLDEFGELPVEASTLQEQQLSLEAVDPANRTPEQAIVHHCKLPSSADDLAAATGLELPALYGHLFDLQLSGKIFQNAAGLFEAL
jgi:DNA processing protein